MGTYLSIFNVVQYTYIICRNVGLIHSYNGCLNILPKDVVLLQKKSFTQAKLCKKSSFTLFCRKLKRIFCLLNMTVMMKKIYHIISDKEYFFLKKCAYKLLIVLFIYRRRLILQIESVSKQNISFELQNSKNTHLNDRIRRRHKENYSVVAA